MKKLFLITILTLLTAFTVACADNADTDTENNGEDQNNAVENDTNSNPDADEDSNADEQTHSGFEDIDVDVVATVNGEEITADELLQNEQYLVDQYQMFGMSVEGMEGQIRETALNQLINTRLVVQNAVEEGLVPSDEEIQEEYENLIEELKTYYETEDVNEVFEEFETTEEEVRQDIRTDLITARYLEANIQTEEVTDEEIQEAYDAYVAQMEQAEEEADSLDNVRGFLEQQIQDEKYTDAQRQLIDRLRDNSEIEILI